MKYSLKLVNKIKLDKTKVLNLILGTIILFLCAGIGFLLKDGFNDETSQKVQEFSGQQEQPNKTVQKLNSNGAKVDSPKVDIAQLYPFYIEQDKSRVSITSKINSTSLPAIPNYQPRPNLPLIIPPPMPEQEGIQQNQNKEMSIKGVLTGDDNKNMAIMNDGKVVSVGDVYQDGRIAYIGGDGIKFENGKSINYK